jgi:hypothetical protein
MNIWLQNSIKNLLLLSENKISFQEAIKEWFYTGEIFDNHLANQICELCEKDKLRYHFEIRNQRDNYLLVGSNCIEKFDIVIYDKGGKEIKTDKDKYLKSQVKIRHVERTLSNLHSCNPLGQIKGFTKKELDDYCLMIFERNNKFYPKMLNYVFLRFNEENIIFDESMFKISMRTKEYRKEFLSLSEVQFERIKGALTINQREYYINNKMK